MSRLPRFDVIGLPYHVIQRGNDRCAVFGCDADRAFYLDVLRDAADRTGCAVHAYVLMTNHVHLLVTPRRPGGLGRMLQSLGRRYVRRFNDSYRRTGTLWEGRYKACPIDGDAYFLSCVRYIELNPVRAGMVAHPGDHPWSSWPAHAEGRSDPLLDLHPLYMALGETAASRQAAYRALFAEVLADDTLAAIRDATNKAWPLGGERFKEELARLTARRLAPAPRGRPRKAKADGPAQGALPI